MTAPHPNIGLLDDFARALGVEAVEARALLNAAGVPFRPIDGTMTFSRRHAVEAFRSGVVKAVSPGLESAVSTKYDIAESGELYRASLPRDGSVPF